MTVEDSSKRNPFLEFLKANILTLATLAGVIIGVILGLGLKFSTDEPWSQRDAMYVSYIGKLFLNMLKCIIIPLIIPSLIAAIGSLDLSLSGKIGLRAIIYYMATTVSAVILGIILVVSIQPGSTSEVENKKTDTRNVLTADTLMDLLRNCFPPNIIQATTAQYRTALVNPKLDEMLNLTDDIENNIWLNNSDTWPCYQKDNETAPVCQNDKNTWMIKGGFSNNTNILGLIIFSIVTGIAISVCGEDGKPLLRFFESVSIVMMRVTTWIIYLAPVGVLFLIAGQILGMKNISKEFQALGLYFGTVLIGIGVHGFIVLPILYTIFTRSLPFKFMLNMGNALVTAFGTASSSATLPVTINCLEEKNKVDTRIARFVLPIGATINMDGTALYEAVAAIFIAQLHNIYPSIGQIIAISITATAASIGAAGIPQAGLVTMVMVLDTVGLPSEAVAYILSVDWLLDRFRTAINVLGDSIGAGIVNHLSKKELDNMNRADNIPELESVGMHEKETKNGGVSNEGFTSL